MNTDKHRFLKAEFRALDAEHELLKRLPWPGGEEPFAVAAVRRRKAEIARQIFDAGIHNRQATATDSVAASKDSVRRNPLKFVREPSAETLSSANVF